MLRRAKAVKSSYSPPQAPSLHRQNGSLTAPLPTIQSLTAALPTVQQPNNDQDLRISWARDVLMLVDRSGDVPPAGPVSIQDPQLVRLVQIAVPLVIQIASAKHPNPIPIFAAEAIYLRATFAASGAYPEHIAHNPRISFHDFEQAARAGYAPAWFRLGRNYENFNDAAHARDCFERGVKLNVESCLYRMGMAHLMGQLGLPAQPEMGLPLILRAATLASVQVPQPAYVYGLLLLGEFEAMTIPPQCFAPLIPSHSSAQQEARLHLERAAFLHFAPAQYKLGHAYEFALPPFPFDALLSVQYYSLASQQGEVEADMALSKWFLCGAEGEFDKDENLALTFAERAARKGLPSAEFAMGYYKEVGVGEPPDVEAARRWYQLASDHGNADAVERLAALSQPSPQSLSRQEHDTITESKLTRKRTQAKQRSEREGSVSRVSLEDGRQVVEVIRKVSVSRQHGPPGTVGGARVLPLVVEQAPLASPRVQQGLPSPPPGSGGSPPSLRTESPSYAGYGGKFAPLHSAEDYEANNAPHMPSITENFPDKEIRRMYSGTIQAAALQYFTALQENYVIPRETVAAIDAAIHEIFSLCPLVLIDVTTGRLCNTQQRVQVFKSETPFKKLVSETVATKIDRSQIRQSVAKYFTWIMFSHTWEGEEPTFKDVNLVDSVWKLGESPLNKKLRQFCTMACEDGHRWVWSDTCCIDKDTSAILSQSLISMYTWYENAAETLVYLADVLSSAELGDLALTNSRWMTRAWTLQELLASKVVRFYSCDWKLYLNDKYVNHKESPVIKQELAKAMGVAPETITSFQPEGLGVREKLRLASARNATVEEDVAYSLIGIFSSDIVPRYGLGKTALGHLLENIVARTGDVTVIAWTGKPLPYNSALPASLSVYGQVTYSPPPMEANELDTCVEQLRTHPAPQDTIAFYYRVIRLPRATFLNRCLQLPCIMFSVAKIGVQELDGIQGNLYRTMVSLLGKVEFRTADVMPLRKPRRLVFVHPWFHDLCDPIDGFVSDDEEEAEYDVGSGDEAETRSDVGSGDGTDDDGSEPASPLNAEPSARVDPYTQALRLVARLGRPFNALLFEQQSNGRYKRVASEHEIIVAGVPYQTNPKDIKAKVLEVV